eukprot:191497_1
MQRFNHMIWYCSMPLAIDPNCFASYCCSCNDLHLFYRLTFYHCINKSSYRNYHMILFVFSIAMLYSSHNLTSLLSVAYLRRVLPNISYTNHTSLIDEIVCKHIDLLYI